VFKGIATSRVYHFGSKSTKRVMVNRGYYQFLSKWGMSSGTFTKNFLRRGNTFDGPLRHPPVTLGSRMKNFFKRLDGLFHKNI